MLTPSEVSAKLKIQPSFPFNGAFYLELKVIQEREVEAYCNLSGKGEKQVRKSI